MTAILSPDRIVGGTVIEIEHPAGLLRFEEFREGEWLTLKGQPAMTSRRGYYLDGEPLEFSVSEIVGLFEKPALYRWHEDRGVRGAVRAERLGELEGMPEEEWVRRVRALGLGADAMRDEAADRGQAIHAAFKTLAEGGRVDVDDFPSEWMPWLKGALRAWLALRPEVIASEFLVCHPEHRYAGRPDLYAMVDGKRTVIDYKTSKKGVVYTEAHWQARGYSEALEPSGYEPAEDILLVAVDDAGGFSLTEGRISAAQWEALLVVHAAHRQARS